MPNLANILKDEIRRLAKKEVKSEIAALRKVSTQHRKDLAALKRDNRALARRVALLESAARRRDSGPAAVAESGPQLRFSPGWVVRHREKLGFSQAQYAALVGVSAMTIHNWERGHSRPREAQLAAWGAIKKLGKREALAKLG